MGRVAERGFDQTIVSPAGGAVPLEPRSLRFPSYDRSAKEWHGDPAKMELLENTANPDEIDAASIVLTATGRLRTLPRYFLYRPDGGILKVDGLPGLA